MSLAHLAPRLYRYNDVDLQQARHAILSTDLRLVMSQMGNQGYSVTDGARALLAQSREYERMWESARQSVFAVADSTSRPRVEAAMRAIDAGLALPMDAPDFDSGMTGAALKAYVLATWGKLANQETALQVACLTTN